MASTTDNTLANQNSEIYFSPSKYLRNPTASLNEHSNWSSLSTDFIDQAQSVLEHSNGTRSFTFRPHSSASSPLHQDAPTAIFIHGGYWQEGTTSYYLFVAKHLLATAGDSDLVFSSVIIIGVPLAPDYSVEEIVKEVSKNISEALDEQEPHTEQKKDLLLFGHSSGGHIALSSLMRLDETSSVTSWQSRVRALILVSPVLNVVQLVPTNLNDALGHSEETAKKVSPLHNIAAAQDALKGRKAYLLVGDHEPPPFRLNALKFIEVMTERKGLDIALHFLADTDHFEILDANSALYPTLTSIARNTVSANS